MSMKLMDDEDHIKLSFKYVNAIEYAMKVCLLNIKQFFHRILKLLPLLNWLKLLNGHIHTIMNVYMKSSEDSRSMGSSENYERWK